MTQNATWTSFASEREGQAAEVHDLEVPEALAE